MIPIPPGLLAIGGTVTLLAGLGAGWAAHGVWTDANQFRALERADKREDAARAQGFDQGKSFAEFAAANQQSGAADTRTIRETFREIHVPGECAAPPAVVGVLENGVRGANAAAAGIAGATLPGPAVPTGAPE